MEIYLVRHTTPDVAKGVCYGQSDIDVTDTFVAEASVIQKFIPENIASVFSSPLKRCMKLGDYLFPGHTIQSHHGLKEVNCGDWELQAWDDIPRAEIDNWINGLTVRMPQGESYTDLYERVKAVFLQIHQQPGPIAIVTHGGVIRSILSHLTNTPLEQSFKVFSLHYGCVIKITGMPDGLRHEVLSNIAQGKETHKPSYL